MAINHATHNEWAKQNRRSDNFLTGHDNYDRLPFFETMVRQQPQEADFADLYSELEIRQDLKEVEAIKAKPEYIKERPPISIMAEAEFYKSIKKRGWLGESLISKTSEFDDVMRGTDYIVQVPDPDFPDDESKMIPIAIDVTAAMNEDTVLKKIDSSMLRLRRFGFNRFNPPHGHLNSVKYLRDENDKAYNRPMNHYVVALSKEQIATLGNDSLRAQAKFEGREFKPESAGDREYMLEAELQTLLSLRRQAFCQIIREFDEFETDKLTGRLIGNIKNIVNESKNGDLGQLKQIDLLTDYLDDELKAGELRGYLVGRGWPEIWRSICENRQLIKLCDQQIDMTIENSEYPASAEKTLSYCFESLDASQILVNLNPFLKDYYSE